MPKLRPLLEEGAGDLERWVLEAALRDGPATDEARRRTLAAVRLATGATASAGVGVLAVKSRLVVPALLKWLAIGSISMSAVGAGVYELTTHTTDTASVGAVQAPVSSGGSLRSSVPRPSASDLAGSAVASPSPSEREAPAIAPTFDAVPAARKEAAGAPSPVVDEPRREHDVEGRIHAGALAPAPPVVDPTIAASSSGGTSTAGPASGVGPSPAVATTSLDPPAPSSPPPTPAPSAAPPPPAASSPAAPSLRDEAALLESVREMLARSDATSALGALGRYDTGFPRGLLREEAAVLRVEALRSAGRRDQARALAQRFVEANPSSSYAPRMRKLLDSL